jgi:hypothetical protein
MREGRRATQTGRLRRGVYHMAEEILALFISIQMNCAVPIS